MTHSELFIGIAAMVDEEEVIEAMALTDSTGSGKAGPTGSEA